MSTTPPTADIALRRRRDALAEQVALAQLDLGGLAYEMAIRDHFRLDVLVRRAALLQELDAQLAELDRALALNGGVGTAACPGCGALHGRGAVYCWQCGHGLVELRAVDGAQPDASAEIS